MNRRRTARWAGALTLVWALAACAGPPPEPAPEPEPAVAPPIMEVAQAERILEDIAATLAAGDAALDASRLPERVGGPALASRTAQYTIAQASQDTSAITALPTAAQALVVPDDATWPREIVVVTEQPQDLQSPRLMVLRQDSPRDQFVLWGWARLLPGVTMPPTADPALGSPQLAPDAEGLIATPANVVIQYADLLAQGDASQYAGNFSGDATREAIIATREAFRQAVEGAGGQLTETYTPVEGELFSFATADGGALVVASLSTVTEITLRESTLNVSGSTAALLGVPQIRSTMSMTWSDVVAFAIPPAGSTDQVTVLAAEHVLTAVTGS